MRKIMIDWNINYSLGAADADFQKIKVKIEEVTPIDLNDDWMALREELIGARDSIFEEYGFDRSQKLEYSFDVLFGLKLFQILNKQSGFGLRQASDDNIWRFLSVRVVPDVVHSRFNLSEDHYYRMSRRIWLKTIWWYVYLAWTGEENSTWELLKHDTTDTILQLVERPGLGYYRNVDHEILIQITKYRKDGGSDATTIFREVLKLNTARLTTTSPELIDGGVQAYVKSLYDSVINGD